MDFLREERTEGKPIILGILGKHEKISCKDIHEKILHPLVSVLGRLPDKMIISNEGQSSAYISIWSEKNKINTHNVEADWRKLQRRAGIMRDARIIKDSTHLLIFDALRSKNYELIAMREAKKGRSILFVEYDPIQLVELVVS